MKKNIFYTCMIAIVLFAMTGFMKPSEHINNADDYADINMALNVLDAQLTMSINEDDNFDAFVLMSELDNIRVSIDKEYAAGNFNFDNAFNAIDNITNKL